MENSSWHLQTCKSKSHKKKSNQLGTFVRALPEREVTAINEQLGWGIFYKHNSCENPSDWRPVAWHRRWNGAEVPEWYSFADEKVGNNPTNVPTERVGVSTTLSWLVNLKTHQTLWVKMDCNPTRDVAMKNDWNFPAANVSSQTKDHCECISMRLFAKWDPKKTSPNDDFWTWKLVKPSSLGGPPMFGKLQKKSVSENCAISPKCPSYYRYAI